MNRFVERLRQISVRRRLMYAFVILCALPLVALMFVSAGFEYWYGQNNARKNYENFAYESSIRVNDVFDQLELKFDYLVKNNDVLTDLYLYSSTEEYQTVAVVNRIENTIASIMSTKDEILYTAIGLENEESFMYPKNQSAAWYMSAESGDIQSAGWYYNPKEGQAMFYRMEEIEIDYIHEVEAVFVMVLDQQILEGILRDATGSYKQRLVIKNNNGRVIVGRGFEQDITSKIHVITHPIGETGYYIESSFLVEAYNWQGVWTTLILFVIVLFVAGGTLYLVNESIRLPLEALLSRIDAINNDKEQSSDLMTMEAYPKDEHGILNREFTSMLRRLDRILQETYKSKITEAELRTRIKELELIDLQQRINPHFFYNLLDNVFWMTQMKGYDEIGEMVSALGGFFKTSVSEKGAYVTIGTEVENAKSYVRLQEIMHKNQFNAIWSIEPEILHHKTVKLVLQPIIENCINHGFEGVEEGGMIRINGYKEKNQILFEISDNGKGMSEATCQKIREKMNSAQLGVGDSIGMRNVNQRIKIYFGEAYGIHIQSKLGVGTTVSLTIPIKE